MSELVIPQINNNDTHALLVEWSVEEGVSVAPGDVVAILETSKSTFELEASESGILKIEKEAGEEYAFGERIGYIGEESGDTKVAVNSSQEQVNVQDSRGILITDAAKRLIASEGIQLATVQSLGKRIVREKDIQALLRAMPSQEREPDPVAADQTQQSAIARVVTRSHREIPAAFLVKRVYCDQALAFLKEQGSEQGKMLSLPDLIVSELGAIHEAFPLFFANTDSEGRLKSGLPANIGVTFDFGKGLFVPVIESVSELTLAELAQRMMRFRMKAMRGRFKESEMSGGALSVSLNTDPDTVFVRPLILPPQTCMISLGAVFSECQLGQEGELEQRRFVNIGIAYDHRFINGFESQEFAATLKKRIEGVESSIS